MDPITTLLVSVCLAASAVLSAPPTVPAPAPAPAEADPRWTFFTSDRTPYESPWYAGAHRIMIPFGCTAAPYYSPDPRCEDGNGFHHGIDIAMPCGTPLLAARPARVVSAESLGPAYGEHPILLRSETAGFDLVIGHARRVFVAPGDQVRTGQEIARSSDSAAPDGCHLHFEQREVGGGLSSATSPRSLLAPTAGD